MKTINDIYAMRYRVRAYTDKLAMLHDKRITDICLTAELVTDKDIEELMKHLTELINALDVYCGYAECDVSDPLDWDKGDIWHKAQYVWDGKIWSKGKDLVRQKCMMSVTTKEMIKLYDTDADTKKMWDMITEKIYDPRDAADAIIKDVLTSCEYILPLLVKRLALLGHTTCDWVAVARHIKEVQKNERNRSDSSKKSDGCDQSSMGS